MTAARGLAGEGRKGLLLLKRQLRKTWPRSEPARLAALSRQRITCTSDVFGAVVAEVRGEGKRRASQHGSLNEGAAGCQEVVDSLYYVRTCMCCKFRLCPCAAPGCSTPEMLMCRMLTASKANFQRHSRAMCLKEILVS